MYISITNNYKFNNNYGYNTKFKGINNQVLNNDAFLLFMKYKEQLSNEKFFYAVKNQTVLKEIPDKILRNIANTETKNMIKMPKDRVFNIITGRAGSGKTTLVKNLNMAKNFYITDADKIKILLPGYKEYGAGYVHEASCIINRINISEALKRGVNTVVQTTSTIDYIDELISEAKLYHYKINLHHINITEDNAIKRCLMREQTDGRHIDPEVIKQRKYIDDIASNYQKKGTDIREIFLYDNNEEYIKLIKHKFIT